MNIVRVLRKTFNKGRIPIPLPAIFIVLVAASLAFSHYFSISLQKEAYTKLYHTEIHREVRAIIVSHFDTINYPKWQEVVDLGEKLISNSRVRGGTIYTPIGEELNSFGIRPTLTFSGVRAGMGKFYYNENDKLLDVFYKGEELGLTETVVFRVDVKDINIYLNDKVAAEMKLYYYKAGFVLFIATFVFFFLLIYPMKKLSLRMKALSTYPENADDFKLNWRRADSIGETARYFDAMADRISYLFAEDLAAAEQLLEKSTLAVLQFNPEGELMNLNPAAFILLQVLDEEEAMTQMAEINIEIKHDKEVETVRLMDLQHLEHMQTMVRIITPSGSKRCLMNTNKIVDKNENIKRFIVTFYDLSKEMDKMDKMEREITHKANEVKASERKRTEGKFLLESCLLIMASMQGGAQSNPEDEISLLPDRILNRWYDEAQKADLVSGRLEHDVLPIVRGTLENIEAVLRQSLCLIHARSLYEAPVLCVEAFKYNDNMVGLIAYEGKPDARRSQLRPTNMPHAGRGLASAGLMSALKNANGELINLNFEKYENSVCFALPSGETGAVALAKKAPIAHEVA